MTLTKNEHGYWECRMKGKDGKFKSFSTHRKNKSEAREIIKQAKLDKIELAAEAGLLTPNVFSVLVTGSKNLILDAIDPWKEWLRYDHQSENTIASSEAWVRSWVRSRGLERRPLASIGRPDIDDWLNHRALKTKAATRECMLSSLRSFFKFCSANGWSQGNPASLVRIDYALLSHEQKEKTHRLLFSEEEVMSLLSATAPIGSKPSAFWHAAVAIGRYTGLRLSDICGLEWSCLSVPGKISVWTMKRDRRVELQLQPEALAKSIASVERTDPVYLFPEQRNVILDPARRSGLSVAFGRLCQHCSILGKSFHCLRHCFISECNRNGVPMEHIASMVGHADTQTTQGYVHED